MSTMVSRVPLQTPPQTRLEWPCRLIVAKHGGPDCPICRSPTDTPLEQQHRQAVLGEVTTR